MAPRVPGDAPECPRQSRLYGPFRLSITFLRAVAPGISEALVTTALGLSAAIPAAVAYNWFGSNVREFGARMDDFALEFLNMTERNSEE